MFGNNSVIALDIGSKTIKYVLGKPKKNGIVVTSYGKYNSPKNSYSDGNIIDRLSIYKAISEIINEGKLNPKYVIAGIKGPDIVTRIIEMPLLSEVQLKKAVQLEIQQYLPMDPNEYVIDSKIMSKIDTREKKVFNVLLVAAPKRKIEDHYYVCEKLGLKVKAVDLITNGITRFFESDLVASKESNKSVTMVEIGYDSTTITLIEDGRLFLVKEVPIGVRNLDSIIKKVYAADTEEIESIREKVIRVDYNENIQENADPRSYYANNIARQLFDSLIEQIIKIIDFYISSGFNKNMECIFLYGGGAKHSGLIDYIRTSTNIETKYFNCERLTNIHKLDNIIRQDIGPYLNCIGLLLRKE